MALILTMVAIGSLGAIGYSVFRVFGGAASSAADGPAFGGGSPYSPGGSLSPSPLAGSGSADPTRQAAKASSYSVRTVDDLMRVCDRWYYPQSPVYAAPAPHPISILMKDRMDLPSRIAKSFYGQPPGKTAAVRAAWEPADPAVVQLVACLDLVETGQPISSCRFDDPQPDTLPINEGIYQLSVYEVATRRKVAEVRMTGEDEQCPTIVMIGQTRMLYSAVNERQLVDALTRYVEQ